MAAAASYNRRMAGLRIGIDVGGTFTHGVVLRPPGTVLARACVATTHRHAQGVAAGVEEVLGLLLDELDRQGLAREGIELVAHSTTQATNALLEGDVAPVLRVVLVPPGEGWLCRNTLRGKRLDVGGGHGVPLETEYAPWEAAEVSPSAAGTAARATGKPVAIIQPLAGGYALREEALAEQYRAQGRPVVTASSITQVLGLAARARTATVNAAMLPAMLATAEFTAQAVARRLPGAPVQVVRSDGGAMSLGEMRRLPVLSLLSGPAAGASAALHRTGLSEVVFIEVGGTSTDVTLIKEGRVRHRYANVGGQRLMVPALDLRTVAVGGGSMLRSDGSRFGPRSAHIAGLPYLFQALQAGKGVKCIRSWDEEGVLGPQEGGPLQVDGVAFYWDSYHHGRRPVYAVAEMDDGSLAALTLTDEYLSHAPGDGPDAALSLLGKPLPEGVRGQLAAVFSARAPRVEQALEATWRLITEAVAELSRSHDADLAHFTLAGGGGGAPLALKPVGERLRLQQQLVADHAVISAIGAALAVSCVSLSRSTAQPTGADIAGLVGEAGERLRAQGAERFSTDYEYDPLRQVLTVTARGSRPYEQAAQPRSENELATLARSMTGAGAACVWQGAGMQLWTNSAPDHAAARWAGAPGCALDATGRVLWRGALTEHFPAAPGQLEATLSNVIEQRTRYTDGGPALPGLALLAAGRLIPLEQLGSRELIADVLRWESPPADEPACFIIRR
jgi:N-methylhydantoinase A/oxoprolinase/acetone carboxylase beta subunit